MTLTLDEIRVIMGLLDVGVKAAGLQVFRDNGGLHLQSALVKLQAMADEAEVKVGDNDGPE